MSSSGTYSFDMNIEEIISRAYEWAEGELVTGEDLKKARIALQLLLIDMQNRGHPLAEIQNKTFTTVSASASYTLPTDVVDVLDVVVVRSSVATPLERIPLFEYHNISDKTTQGLPSQYTIQRARSAPIMTLYQTPDKSTDTIDYWCVTRIEDVGTNYQNNLDLSYRYLPAVTFGLAYFLSLGRTGFDPAKRAELLNNYTMTLDAAMIEDTDRSSYQVTPFGYHRR